MKRIVLSVALYLAATAQVVGPPPSAAFTQEQAGALMQAIFGVSASGYANLSVVPAGGLYVAVQPPSGQLGVVYVPANTNSPPQFVVQGVRVGTIAPIGPVAVPSTIGYSQQSLIECSVAFGDLACQAKAGTPYTSSPPALTVDSGYTSLAVVTVAQGATSVTTGNITASATIAPFPFQGGTVPNATTFSSAVTLGSTATFNGAATFNAGIFGTSATLSSSALIGTGGSGQVYLGGTTQATNSMSLYTDNTDFIRLDAPSSDATQMSIIIGGNSPNVNYVAFGPGSGLGYFYSNGLFVGRAGTPVGSCVAGTLWVRNDSGASAGNEAYVCRNVSGTGTWEALSGG